MPNTNKTDNMQIVENSHNKKTIRTQEEKKVLIDRLSRIEGQVRGLKSLVESDTYLIDLYVQVQAASSALNALNKCILEEHFRKYIDNKNYNNEAVNDALFVIEKLIK